MQMRNAALWVMGGVAAAVGAKLLLDIASGPPETPRRVGTSARPRGASTPSEEEEPVDSAPAPQELGRQGSPVKVVVTLDAVRVPGAALAVRDGDLGVLRRLAAEEDLYLVHQVGSDEEEAAAKAFVAALALPRFPPHRFVCCATLVGRKAVIRQLAPVVAVDANPDCAAYLAPVLSNVCLVAPDPAAHPDLFTVASLGDYVALVLPDLF